MPPSRRAAPPRPLPRSPRPMLTIFDASQAVATDSSSRALVRFQVRDAASRVRVRLAFVSLAGDGHQARQPGTAPHGHRSLGQAITLARELPGEDHGDQPARAQGGAGDDRRGRSARSGPGRRCRATACSRSRARTTSAARTRGSAPPAAATSTRARTSRPPRARRWSRPRPARSTGAPTRPAEPGYYLVLDADGEDFMYVFMHLRQGSLLVVEGGPRRRRTADRAGREHRQLGRARTSISRSGRAPGTPAVTRSTRFRCCSPGQPPADPRRYHPGCGEVAQSVEHTTENRGVAGSIPALAIPG